MSSYVDLDKDMRLLVERLEGQFGGVGAGRVDEVVRECAARFDDVPVKNYVCLLTEKLAQDRLRSARAA